MYIVTFTSLLALLFTYLDSINKFRGGMKLGFVLVTILGAIHYDYGNDYMSYLNVYNDVTRYEFDLEGILSKVYYKEPGWVLLCWLFKPIGGFFMMVAALNIIQNTIVYRFIIREVEKSWWPLAVFVYLFSTSYYLMSFSMMRQEFVLILFLGLWKYIKNRKWWIALVFLYLCSLVHTSALVLLPFSFWGYVPMKKGWYIGLIYLASLLFLWFGKEFVNEIFMLSISIEEMADYTETYGKGSHTMKIGLGFMVNLLPLVLSLMFLFRSGNQYTEGQRQLVALAVMSNLIVPFSAIIQIIGRLSMYFGVYNISSYSLIYGHIKRKDLRLVLLSIMVFMISYDYVLFFINPVWIGKYTEFYTVFPLIF